MDLSEILKPGTVVAEYDRYSSFKQENGLSLEIQRSFARQMVLQYDLDLVKIYTDEKTSGYHKPLEKRSGMVELLEDARAGVFKVLLTLGIDRLSRNIFELLTIRETLESYGIQLIYTMPGAVQPFEQDIVTEMISYAMSMQESERISARTKEASKLRANNGLWPGGNLPFGYTINPYTKKIEISKGARQVIRKIHFCFQVGESFESIAESLNKDLEPGEP